MFLKGPLPLSSSSHRIFTFLAEISTGRFLKYRTLAVYKSTIPTGLSLPLGQTRLGELAAVSTCMKSIFCMKPPTPQLGSTWDVKRLGGLKLLSLKLAALLVLTSSARSHELVTLDMCFVSIKGDSREFTLAERTKVSRPGHPPRRIISAYSPNPRICVLRTFK